MQLNKVLLPVKGHPIEQEILHLACDLVRPNHGSVIAVYVIEVPREYPVDAELTEETAIGEQVLRRVETYLGELKCPVVAELVQSRDVGPAVVQEALSRNVDAILMGLSYRLRHGSFTLGQTAPYILENAVCPVIISRAKIPTGF